MKALQHKPNRQEYKLRCFVNFLAVYEPRLSTVLTFLIAKFHVCITFAQT